MKIGRNEPCPCGSGKKYKKCCYDKDNKRDQESFAPVDNTSMPRDLAAVGNLSGRSCDEVVESIPDQIRISPYTIAKMTDIKAVAKLGDIQLYNACKER